MSEVKEPTKPESKNMLKKLASGSSWVSPFRTQPDENDPKARKSQFIQTIQRIKQN